MRSLPPATNWMFFAEHMGEKSAWKWWEYLECDVSPLFGGFSGFFQGSEHAEKSCAADVQHFDWFFCILGRSHKYT
jgi:hypothetical protein